MEIPLSDWRILLFILIGSQFQTLRMVYLNALKIHGLGKQELLVLILHDFLLEASIWKNKYLIFNESCHNDDTK